MTPPVAAHRVDPGPRRRPGRHAAVLVAAGGLVLAGCGGDAEAPTTDAATSPAATSPAPSATTDAPATGGGAAEQVAAASAASEEAGSGAFTISAETTAGEQSLTSTGSGVFDSEALVSEVETTTEVPGQEPVTLTVRQIGQDVFINGLPGLPAEQWAAADPVELGLQAGAFDGSDPSQQLALLEQVGDDVRETGPADVDGVETTGYAGTIDVQKAVRAAQQGDDEAGLGAQLEALGLSSIPFELYVDADGLPVRVVTTVVATAQGAEVTSVSTVDFSDWGLDVTVDTPEDVLPLEELAGAQPAPSPTSS